MNPSRAIPLAGLVWALGLVVIAPTFADELDWKQEFERICIQVESAGERSGNQLRQLIDDSERLLEQLAEVDEPRVKIYVQRLQRCRDFFTFMLQAREPKESGEESAY